MLTDANSCVFVPASSEPLSPDVQPEVTAEEELHLLLELLSSGPDSSMKSGLCDGSCLKMQDSPEKDLWMGMNVSLKPI